MLPILLGYTKPFPSFLPLFWSISIGLQNVTWLLQKEYGVVCNWHLCMSKPVFLLWSPMIHPLGESGVLGSLRIWSVERLGTAEESLCYSSRHSLLILSESVWDFPSSLWQIGGKGLTAIVLSAISQTQKDNHCATSLTCGIFKKLKWRKQRVEWWLAGAGRSGEGEVLAIGGKLSGIRWCG